LKRLKKNVARLIYTPRIVMLSGVEASLPRIDC
jgi:hypothetical protein